MTVPNVATMEWSTIPASCDRPMRDKPSSMNVQIAGVSISFENKNHWKSRTMKYNSTNSKVQHVQ